MKKLEYFLNYIKPELLILIPALYFLGMIIKKTELINDKMIPIILGIVSILLSIIWVLATSPLDNAQNILIAIFTGLTQGILCCGTATFANQIYKQFKTNKNDIDKTE